MKVLVTGVAGFIGFHLTKSLIEANFDVVGLDNINSYYSVSLKKNRLENLGIFETKYLEDNKLYNSNLYNNFKFYKVDLENRNQLKKIFNVHDFDKIVHLAAQAGVRYSIENPSVYINSNIIGFFNLIEEVRANGIEHFIFASSSSVYGESSDVPFSVSQSVDQPISLYAATKKSNELIAHAYSHLYNFSSTGLRFFTVYGPWGRPDMAYFLFAEAIKSGNEIKIFNDGNMYRDFTYIDDIVDGILKIINGNKHKMNKYKIYNIGNNKPENLMNFISIIEKHIGQKAKKKMMPIQPGDVTKTFADIDEIVSDYGYKPKTNIDEGINRFINWFLEYKLINHE